VNGARLTATLAPTTMHNLLALRKSALEGEIRERFARARENGLPKPGVSLLSATLRAVRAQLARVSGDV
jgi:hypothetical protein